MATSSRSAVRWRDAGLVVTCVTPDIWASGKWGWGSFAANDPQIRRDAIQEVKKSMEWAKQLGCEVVDLWFGQDGYDYPFQADYPAAWDRIIAGTVECAEHVPDVKLVLEYKPKEPRTHCFIATVGKTLLLIDKVNRPNVGAMVDIGHSLMAYENVAESAALLHYFGDKLMYMHFNDNWRLWDDDMTVGSVHTIEMLELLYWLDRLDYSGWYALDIFPYRENGIRAASESIQWIQGLHGLLDKIGRDRIAQVIAGGDAMDAERDAERGAAGLMAMHGGWRIADGGWQMEEEMAFRFESLDIWHLARAYAGKVYVLTSRFPRHEDYGLRSQMNRAVNSINLNIAEGPVRAATKPLITIWRLPSVLPSRLSAQPFYLKIRATSPNMSEQFFIPKVSALQRRSTPSATPYIHSEWPMANGTK